jgi:hypothetical protein
LWSLLRKEDLSIRPWRRVVSLLSLGFILTGMCLGAFALIYKYLRPTPEPLFPTPTIMGVEFAAALGGAGLLASLFARGQTRLVLAFSSICLLLFLFLVIVH